MISKALILAVCFVALAMVASADEGEKHWDYGHGYGHGSDLEHHDEYHHEMHAPERGMYFQLILKSLLFFQKV